MNNRKIIKIVLWVTIPLLMLTLLFQCIVMAPLWYTNYVSDHRVRVTRFARDIEGECDLTYEELDEYLCESSRMMMDILETVKITSVRRTHRGYYTFVRTADDQRILLYFSYATFLEEFFLCPEFETRAESAQKIRTMKEWRDYENDVYCKELPPVPCHRLNTGAPYYAIYYSDGVDVILYDAPIPIDGGVITQPVRTHSYSYVELKWNPFYYFVDVYRDILYILPIDR